MGSQEGVTKELGVGEVISKTFDLYKLEFVKYFILFLVLYAVYGAVLTAVQNAVVVQSVPTNANGTQIATWFRDNAGALLGSGLVRLLVLVVFIPIIYGSAIKMASDQIKASPVDLGASIRYGMSKLLWVWVVSLVVGIIVIIGLIALVIPGIILAIMFSLVLPVLMIENTDVVKTMSRSRELVGHRWLKTFLIFLVFGIIIVIASVIAGAIGGLFGAGSTEVTNILSAFYLPIIPVGLTVYYYSNLARTVPVQAGPTSAPSGPVAPPGSKFCTNCGVQLDASATFCSKCGAKQPAQ